MKSKSSRWMAVFAAAAPALPGFAQLQFQDQTTTLYPNPTPAEYTNQASICDIDNDGDLDIVFANGQGYSSAGAALPARVFRNNGSGVFTDGTSTSTPGITGWFRGVEFGDIDRDGDWDMVLAQDFNKQPKLLKNNGLGQFTDVSAGYLPAGTLSSARAQFGDVDNDGDLDLVLCNSGTTNRFGSGQPKLYINDGTGHYTDGTATHLPIGNVSDQQDVLFGDVDGDLDLDIHLGSRAGQSKLWINNGSGVYTALAGFPGGSNSYSYDFGDMDGDGDLDLLAANGGAELLLKNNSPSTAWTNVSSEISPNTGIDDNDNKFFDYDNDGDLDFIIGSLASVERIYKNNGSIATADFTQVTGLINAPVDSTLDIKVADLTGDGKLDIITMQGEGGSFTNRIYANIGPASVADTIPPVFTKVEALVDTTSPGPFVVRSTILDGVTSDRGFYDKGVALHYTVDGGAEQVVPMLWSGNSLWRGVIPAQSESGEIAYYVTATDYANNTGTSPTQHFIVTLPPPPCQADVTGDTSIDIDDLFAVINAWGPCASCPADIDGSGEVDVDDLFAVINGWGPCP